MTRRLGVESARFSSPISNTTMLIEAAKAGRLDLAKLGMAAGSLTARTASDRRQRAGRGARVQDQMQRPPVTMLLLLLVACGKSHSHNTFVDNRIASLAEVGAPPEAILASTPKGLHRVRLDTGAAELVSRHADAVAVGLDAFVVVEDGHLVIERPTGRVIVEGIAAKSRPRPSPDGRHVAFAQAITDAPPADHTQPSDEVVVVAIEDARVRRFPLRSPGPPPQPHPDIRWIETSDALLVAYGSHMRLDLTTGAFSPIGARDFELDRRSPEVTDCPARGLRLETRFGERQEIVLLPIAAATDPDRLAASGPRVLVSMTRHRGPSGEGMMRRPSAPQPGLLYGVSFTKTCRHFVFALEDRIYVGEVATGRYALLFHGRLVESR